MLYGRQSEPKKNETTNNENRLTFESQSIDNFLVQKIRDNHQTTTTATTKHITFVCVCVCSRPYQVTYQHTRLAGFKVLFGGGRQWYKASKRRRRKNLWSTKPNFSSPLTLNTNKQIMLKRNAIRGYCSHYPYVNLIMKKGH